MLKYICIIFEAPVYHVMHLLVGAVHYVHNSLLTFVKTRVCMRANDPQEINDAIKKKNPPFMWV